MLLRTDPSSILNLAQDKDYAKALYGITLDLIENCRRQHQNWYLGAFCVNVIVPNLSLQWIYRSGASARFVRYGYIGKDCS